MFVSGYPGAENNETLAALHIGLVRNTSDAGWGAVSLTGSTDFHILQTSSANPNLVIGVPPDKPVLLRSTDAGRPGVKHRRSAPRT